MTVTTPALLFPAISLLLLAYTNRFLALAALVRQLVSVYSKEQKPHIKGQITNLHRRLFLIQYMQVAGVSSFIVCASSMFALFLKKVILGEVLFGLSILLLISSMIIMILELIISIDALNLQLNEIEEHERVP